VFSAKPSVVEFHFEDGSIVNSEEFSPLPEPCFDWVVLSFKKFADQLKRPWMVVHGDYFLTRTFQAKNSDLEGIRTNGLNIFMYEPVFIYNEDKSWPWNGISGSPRFFELENLEKWIIAQNITAPVTIFLGESGLSDWFREHRLFPRLDFKDFSSYFQEAVEVSLKYTWPTAQAPSITHKFLSLNFRYEALREILMGYLQGGRHAMSGFSSFYHFHDRKEFLKRLPFDPTQLKAWPQIENGISYMQGRLPLTLDVKSPKLSDPILESIPDVSGTNNQRDMWKIKSEYFPKAFVFIYSESRPFSPRGEISEKTIHPLFSKKPFLIFAAPYFLKELKKFGFKTFSEYWDESFDEIEDPKERLEKYLQTVDSILSKDISELQKMHRAMENILHHNYDWITRHAIKFQQDKLLKDLNL
jgi:hypothetical protein